MIEIKIGTIFFTFFCILYIYCIFIIFLIINIFYKIFPSSFISPFLFKQPSSDSQYVLLPDSKLTFVKVAAQYIIYIVVRIIFLKSYLY